MFVGSNNLLMWRVARLCATYSQDVLPGSAIKGPSYSIVRVLAHQPNQILELHIIYIHADMHQF